MNQKASANFFSPLMQSTRSSWMKYIIGFHRSRSQLRYLNKKVNRSANEMLFCLAFCEVFSPLAAWIQISNWTTMRFEGASRFDFFLFRHRAKEWMEKVLKARKSLVKTLDIESEISSFLWISNWLFRNNCIMLGKSWLLTECIFFLFFVERLAAPTASSRDAWTSRFTTCCPNSASTRLKWR